MIRAAAAPLARLLPGWSQFNFILRRVALLALVCGSVEIATALMATVLEAPDNSGGYAGGWTALRLAELALFAVSFTGLAISFWVAVMGFVTRAIGGDPASLAAGIDPTRALTGRTVLVMPIYNEDTARVVAGLEATLESLEALPEHTAFELFVLSDTRKPEIAAAEIGAMAALKARHDGKIAVHYRRRERNIGKKAGNIEDFVTRWGAYWDHMIVLDADSVMAGPTLVDLARAMEQNPRTGIVQTVPVAVGRETAFARILQFSGRLYGPVVAAGLAFWSGSEGNYYGHNAIIRIRAFAHHCGLPVLPGRAPLGGHILSHDFVEAALIRRGGWEVRVLPELGGSFEEMPANTIDYATRDRRWAQGNLQHSRIVPLRGLKWASRLHLLMGIMGYAASPIWVLLLVLASVDIGQHALAPISYFAPGFSLFPQWPVARTSEIDLLLAITLCALFGPKLLGLLLALADAKTRRGFGGTPALLSSVLFETAFSMLLAPMMAAFQSVFVLGTLMGHQVAWEAQPRDDRGLTWVEAAHRHAVHTGAGLAWGAAIWVVAPDYLWWLAPVLSGLALSIPLSVLSSRSDLGMALKRARLFLIPEEAAPPPVLARLAQLSAVPLHTPQASDSECRIDLAPAELGIPMPIPNWPGVGQPVPVAAPALIPGRR